MKKKYLGSEKLNTKTLNLHKKLNQRTNQFELKDISTVLGLGFGLNGGVIAHEGIAVVSHGEEIGADLGFLRLSEYSYSDDEDCMYG